MPGRAFEIAYSPLARGVLAPLLPERQASLEHKLREYAAHAVGIQRAQPAWLRAAVASTPSLTLQIDGFATIVSLDVAQQRITVESIQESHAERQPGR